MMRLDDNGISKLLCSHDVNENDEETIFNAVMQWVSYDVQVRQQDLAMLLLHQSALTATKRQGDDNWYSSMSEETLGES
ncbi:Kelch-Like Protein 4 [Manis pentadactyla]|nr:Kelch-Like Protein 4 [Manis pentadactyla]